jgi:energy-coupling factor transport system ATP-binding protein
MDEVEASLRAMWSATTSVVANAQTRRQESLHSTSGAPAISIANLSFSYPDSPPALRDVTLQVQRGRFFAIVGGNGSGKTTLAKHLVGLLRPSSGTVTILGEETRRKSPGELARQAGYVFQNPEHQFVTERVADELAYSLRGRFDAVEIARRVQGLLQTFGLAGYEDENPFALSQGQKRRLSVATMVALEQPILILDEPTFGQDQQSTAALMAMLQTLHAAGTTIILISHDMQLVAEYADEVAVMNEGQIIFQGTPRDLFQQPAILQQASLAMPPLAELARRLGLPPLLTIEEWTKYA